MGKMQIKKKKKNENENNSAPKIQKKKQKSKKANLFKGKSYDTNQMDIDKKKKKKMAKVPRKKRSIRNYTKKAYPFNQIIISSGQEKLNHISKGTKMSIVDPMDVDQATTIHFQDEIIMDILSRLPVESLLRFKCVSKFWNTLISDPFFKMKHLNRAKNDQDSQKLLIFHRCREKNISILYCCPLSPVQLVEDVQKLRLDCPSNPKPWYGVVKCCYDGLAVIQVSDILVHSRFNLLLWNPSIRESILLPALEFPRGNTSRFGLGYDSTSGEYKILHIPNNVHDPILPNHILTLKGGSWRRIDEPPHGIRSFVSYTDSLAFVHATFHWITVSSNYFSMVSFSISNELYGEIPLPKEMLSLRRGYPAIGVSVLDGMLSVHCSTFRPLTTIKVWVLKDYGVNGSWMSLLRITETWAIYPSPKYRFADGEVLFCCMASDSSGHAFRTCSGPFRSWPRSDICQGGQSFTESLISPKSLTY